MSRPRRGHVYRADIGFGRKPWVVVSNNQRNDALNSVIAIRLTTTAKELPSWVPLADTDPLGGYATADDLEQLAVSELGDYLGALSPGTMAQINTALRHALALP